MFVLRNANDLHHLDLVIRIALSIICGSCSFFSESFGIGSFAGGQHDGASIIGIS